MFKSWKFRILFPLIFIGLLVLTKFILWDFVISEGKRVGNLTKISKKGKFWFTKTWEGTLDEGSGDKLTTQFSVSDDVMGKELYAYEGKQVILYYEQHLLGWPRDTTYDVIRWTPKKVTSSESHYDYDDNDELQVSTVMESDTQAAKELSKALFCSLLGSLFKNKELYDQVKAHVKQDNLYLYRQYKKCNE